MNIVGWFLLLAASCAAGAEQGGSVVARVADSEGGAIERVGVVLTEQAPSGTEYKTTTIRTGEFELQDIAPGTYTLTIEAPGFIDKTVPNIGVTLGESRDLETIALKLAGCFAPGVMCDNFGMGLRSSMRRRLWMSRSSVA